METEEKRNQRPTAIVTGASRGIGRAIAIRLAREGYDLLIVSRSRTALEETRERVVEAGGDCVIAAEDLVSTESPARIRALIEAEYGRLDLLVNNAGMVKAGPLGSYSAADWEAVMNLNARAPFLLMQETLPLLEEAEEGIIINIGSVVSKKGYANQSLYAASKHALLGITKCAARELQSKGIRVHAVLPGGVDTEMVASVRPDIDRSRLIAPEEIAETVHFLVSMGGNAAVDEISVRRATKTPWD